ncbi:MAG: hypothetical protein QX199_13305 [Methylococcaceae bacterium]
MLTLLLAGLVAAPCSAEFRDPTQPAYPLPPTAAADGADTVVDNEPVLSAIWISAHSRRATINGVSAKQGQTIVIEPVSSLNPKPANTAATSNKGELLNKVMEYANTQTNRPTPENITAPLGNMMAPLLSAAIGGNKLPQLQDQSAVNKAAPPIQPANGSRRPAPNSAPGIARLPTAAQLSKTGYTPARSTTLKVISIHPNSVTIDQNGEIKILQLVRRPYKNIINSSTH